MDKILTLQTFLTRLAMLCMVPLLLLAAYLAICHVQILQSRFDQDAEHQARNLSAAIDSHLKAQIAALQMLAASPLIDDPNRWSELYSTAQSFREGFGGNVVFADLSMQMLFNTRTPFATSLPKLPVPRGHAAAPAALATGKAAVGDSFIGPIAKEQLIAVAVPVLREEQVRFLLLGVLETRFFQGLLDQVSLPAEWSLTLLDGADTVMAHRAGGAKNHGTGSSSPQKRVVVRSQVSPWSVLLEVPPGVYRSPIATAASALALGILLALATGVYGGSLFGRRLTRAMTSILAHSSSTATKPKIAEIEAVRASLENALVAREQSERAIERNRRILQLFIEHAPAAIAMFDTKMCYIAASRRYLTDYRLEDQRIIDRSHYDVFPEIPERWKEIHRRCLLGAADRHDRDPFPRADGTLDWIRWEIRPWHEPTGKIGGLILFSEVITEQVEAAENLKESEAKFRELFQKHTAVKLIIDPENGNIVDANEAAEKFYGWSADQLRAMRIQEINTLPSEKIHENLAKVENQQQMYFEFRHRLADGSLRDVAVYSSRITIQGKAMLHSIVHDISERKRVVREQEQLREQLTQAQKMESVGQLAGGVAHDYNNMLSVILGYSELALERVAPGDPIAEDLKEIIDAARRSVDITRQLLAFARKQTINPAVLDLNATIDGILKMLRRLIGEDIDLSWRPGANLWTVKIDASQLDQILANLCVNARDAIAGVGKITIETNNLTFDEAYCADHFGFVPGDFAMLAVSDDGSGMDKETLAHIFEPFFSTKGVGQGTGLGLATVYGIVKQNNGFINVYSEPGKGTTFRLYFPRHVGQTEHPRANEVAAVPHGHGETILLVEDESTIRKMGQLMLEKLGYQVLATASPDAALRLAEERAGHIDLLVTDVVMPDMNGRDLADRLHTLYPNIKILFMSGYTNNVIVHRGVLDDGVNFIPKPFSQKDLAIKVHTALGRDVEEPVDEK